jgi:hypothetical protein
MKRRRTCSMRSTRTRSAGRRVRYSAAMTLVGQPFEGILRDCLVLGGAQDQADRRVLAVDGPVLARVVEVEMHLAGVGVGERAELEIDDH